MRDGAGSQSVERRLFAHLAPELRNRDVDWPFIHEDPEGGFWAEVPALPGCYSQGETVDELTHSIREAIAGVLEVLREQGREPDSNIQILDVAI